jgi:hypothetical protein
MYCTAIVRVIQSDVVRDVRQRLSELKDADALAFIEELVENECHVPLDD